MLISKPIKNSAVPGKQFGLRSTCQKKKITDQPTNKMLVLFKQEFFLGHPVLSLLFSLKFSGNLISNHRFIV